MADPVETNYQNAYPKRPSAFMNKDDKRHSILKNIPVNEFSGTFDYVFVFPMENAGVDGATTQQSPVTRHCLNQLITTGLEVYPYLSVQKDELIVLVRCPDDLLREFADSVDFNMKIDETHLRTTLLDDHPQDPNDAEKGGIAPININETITEMTPYQHMFFNYESEVDQNLYEIPPGETTPFVKSVRLKLLYAMFRDRSMCDLEPNKLIIKKQLLALFPLHDRSVSDQLLANCKAWGTFPWDLPTRDLKEYFGEKIALYTVFIGHYSLWLIAPSIIGFVFQLVVWATLDFSSPILPFYSVLICVWSICMLEYWKRTESYTALTWGMTDFEKQEQDRPEYQGEIVKSHITGRDIVFYPPNKMEHLLRISKGVVTAFICLVVGVVAAIYILRFSLQESDSTNPYASTIASVLNAVSIQIFNMIYMKLAVKLTNNENHRTDTLYEDNLISKLFVFQFINSYSSFFFLAFIATNLDKPSGASEDSIGQCGASNCMQPLSINLAIIFGTRLTVANFLDIAIPYYMYRSKRRAETKGVAEDVELTPAENDYLLMQYDSTIESIKNYADTAVQYGYTVLFITALPCASFFSLVNNYAKLKFNYHKLFTYYQRPVPSGAQDIGTWMSIFQILSVVAVITNAGLICFTMDVLWQYSRFGRVWVFIGFQWLLIFIQFLAAQWIDDEPEEVTIQRERMDFIKSKVVEKVLDEDYADWKLKRGKYDPEYDEGGANESHSRTTSCACCKATAGIKIRTKRITQGLDEFPQFTYPISNNPTQWPAALSSESENLPVDPTARKRAAKKQALENTSYPTDQYTSNLSAVGSTPTPSETNFVPPSAAVYAVPPPPGTTTGTTGQQPAVQSHPPPPPAAGGYY